MGVAFIAILFLANSVLAISTDMKANYEMGETLIVEISGNILAPLEKEQIDFRRGHVSVPFEQDARKLGGKYFIWAIAPNKEENYTLVIKNILTSVLGKTEEIYFEQNFSVGGNVTDYYMKPGFVYALEDFSIDVFLNDNFDKEISIDFPEEKEIMLKPGNNKIDFSISEISDNGFRKINIGKYIVPIYILDKKEEIRGDENMTLRLNPVSVVSTVLPKDLIDYPFTIINFGDDPIYDIDLSYNKEIFNIDVEDRIIIASKDSANFNISIVGEITEEVKEEGIDEVIYIKAGDFSLNMPVKISFTENEGEVKTRYLEEDRILYYCSELNGKICTGGEICDIEASQSLDDGICCIGGCVPEKKSKERAWIGYIIAGVVLIGIVFVFLRYRKVKSKEEGFSKRVKKAEERLPGKIEKKN